MWSLVPLLLLAAGCWQPRYFAPRENRNGTSPDGDAAAIYALPPVSGVASAGEVRVWSHGARAHYIENDTEVVDLHVGFELENNGSVPLALDASVLACEELFVDGLLQAPLAPHTIQGRVEALPGGTVRVDLVFRPPTTVPADRKSVV